MAEVRLNFIVHYCLTGCSLVRLFLAARNASVPTERVDEVRKLAASLQCPLLFAEDQVCTDYIFSCNIKGKNGNAFCNGLLNNE